MAFVLFLISIALPVLEIIVLVKVGQIVGLWTILGLLFGVALLGLGILYAQGWSTLAQVQRALVRGEPPLGPMLDGALQVVAGVLLLTPGLITDVMALPLLLPPVRRWISRRILSRVSYSAQAHTRDAYTSEQPGPVIEGEFERLDERPLDAARREDHRPR